MVAQGAGRGEVRRPARPGSLPTGRVLAIAVGVTATIVAWGLLVFAAIDFGREARAGSGADWGFLALATVGAVACMFLAIVLASRLQNELRGTGSTSGPARRSAPRPAPPPVEAAEPTRTAGQNKVTPGRHRS